MTSKEFFTNVLAISHDTEMVAFAKKELAKIDSKNEKARIARMEKTANDAPLFQSILDILATTTDGMLTSVVATKCGVSTPKAQALLAKLADNGKVSGFEVKLPKIGTRKAWKLVAEVEEIANSVEALDRELTV